MADKLGNTVTSNISFVNGEPVTAAKMNALFNVLKNAIKKIEYTIGDIHDESYPYSDTVDSLTQANYSPSGEVLGLTSKKLDIASIARLIGPASALNPQHLSNPSDTTVTESIPAGYNSFILKYPIKQSSTPVFDGSDLTAFVTSTTAALMQDDGDYYINKSKGEIHCIKTTTTGTSITYEVRPSWGGPYASYYGSSFNVIPDPSQAAKCTATGPSGGLYSIALPLIDNQQTNDTQDDTVLSDNDLNYQVQLELPQVLNTLTTGDVIPQGFLYLTDLTTNTIYKDAVYYYNSQSVVDVGNVELTVENEFQITTVGTNITQSILDLNLKMFQLRRGIADYTAIPVDSLSNKSGPGPMSGQETYGPSEVDNNHFPQYLHRDGWFSSYDDTNINDQNGMRGDLVLLSSLRSGGSRSNLSQWSAKIRFGSGTVGPYFWSNGSNLEMKPGTAGQLFKIYTNVHISGYGISTGTNTSYEGPYKFCNFEDTFIKSGSAATVTIPIASILLGKTLISYSVLCAGHVLSNVYSPPNNDSALKFSAWVDQSTYSVLNLDNLGSAYSSTDNNTVKVFFVYKD